MWSLGRTRLDAATLVGIAAFALLCLYPALGARFVLVDDHEILRYAAQGNSFDATLSAVLDTEARTLGRFRPAYWVVRLAEVRVFGDNPVAWHATVVALGVAAAFMLFGMARRAGVATVPAGLAAATLLVAPGVSSVWVRLGPPETLGTVLFLISGLAAAVAARSRSRPVWDALFVVTGVLCMLAKEPFALTALGLAGFRLFASGQWSRPPARALTAAALVLVGGLVVALADYHIGATAGTATYGGRYLAGASPISYAVVLAHNALILVYASCAWIAVLAAPHVSQRRSTQAWLVIALAAAVVVPQLGLYSLQGVMEGRYEVPSTIALSLLTGTALWSLAGAGHRRLHQLGVAVWSCALILFGFSTWSYASAFSMDSQELDEMLGAITRDAPPGSIVGLLVDPGRRYEPALSIVDHLASRGRPDLAFRLIAVNTEGPYTAGEQALADSLEHQTPSLATSDCTRLATVVVLTEGPTKPAIACPLDSLHETDFEARLVVWGGETVSFRPRVPGLVTVGYRAYLS